MLRSALPAVRVARPQLAHPISTHAHQHAGKMATPRQKHAPAQAAGEAAGEAAQGGASEAAEGGAAADPQPEGGASGKRDWHAIMKQLQGLHRELQRIQRAFQHLQQKQADTATQLKLLALEQERYAVALRATAGLMRQTPSRNMPAPPRIGGSILPQHKQPLRNMAAPPRISGNTLPEHNKTRQDRTQAH